MGGITMTKPVMEKSKNESVATSWLSTLCCWETAIHTYPWSIVEENDDDDDDKYPINYK